MWPTFLCASVFLVIMLVVIVVRMRTGDAQPLEDFFFLLVVAIIVAGTAGRLFGH